MDDAEDQNFGLREDAEIFNTDDEVLGINNDLSKYEEVPFEIIEKPMYLIEKTARWY